MNLHLFLQFSRLAASTLLLAALAWCAGAQAQAQVQVQVQVQVPELNAALHESIIKIEKPAIIGSISLETTLYRPAGDGHFPVVVISHGKASGDPKFQARYRPASAVRYFLQRGFVVLVPMRQGFSKSGGSYIGGGCNIESNGRVQAEDVKAVLDYVVQQPYVDKDRILLVGQSHGGWTTLAAGALNYPGVKGLVNFAGGLRQENCVGWQSGLARGAGAYAAQTQVPSLWFYGDNDSYFEPPVWQAMFERYTAAGGKARLVSFGSFGSDAHTLFVATAGAAVWQPEVSRFLEELGLPSQPTAAFSRYGAAGHATSVSTGIPGASAAAPADGGDGLHGFAKQVDELKSLNPLMHAVSQCSVSGTGQ